MTQCVLLQALENADRGQLSEDVTNRMDINKFQKLLLLFSGKSMGPVGVCQCILEVPLSVKLLDT